MKLGPDWKLLGKNIILEGGRIQLLDLFLEMVMILFSVLSGV